jgi:hypothetical protein
MFTGNTSLGFRPCRSLLSLLFLTALLLSTHEVVAGEAPTREISPTKSNSMDGDRTKQPTPVEVLSWRYIDAETKFVGHPIQTLTVLNSTAGTINRDLSLSQFYNKNKKKIDVVVNGTFFDTDSKLPAGSTIRHAGHSFYKDASGGISKNRGGVAVLADGRIILGTARGHDVGNIENRFGTGGQPVHQFMGGGALLVNSRYNVTSNDLRDQQDFDQGGGGFQAPQFRSTKHCVVAVLKGQAYLLVNKVDMTGKQLQAELAKHGFETAIKFDGGSKCYYNDGDLASVTIPDGHKNPTGFAAKSPTFYVACNQAKMKIKPSAKKKSIQDLGFSDVSFATSTQPILLTVTSTSLQYDKTKKEGQTDWLAPGKKITVPLHIKGTSPEGMAIDLTLPAMLEVVEVSRDREELLKNHSALAKRLKAPNFESFMSLLEFTKPDGTAELKQGANQAKSGPFEKDWSTQRRKQFFALAKKIPLLLDCFLATAVYRTHDNASLSRLRGFRDNVLNRSASGKRLVDAYYEYGPILAVELRRRPHLSQVLRPCFDSAAVLLSHIDWDDAVHRLWLTPVLFAADGAVQLLGPPVSRASAVTRFDPLDSPETMFDLAKAIRERQEAGTVQRE